MTDIIAAIKELGYPTAVSIFLMWLVLSRESRMQRLIEFAIVAKNDLEQIKDHVAVLADKKTRKQRSLDQ